MVWEILYIEDIWIMSNRAYQRPSHIPLPDSSSMRSYLLFLLAQFFFFIFIIANIIENFFVTIRIVYDTLFLVI